MDPEFYRGEFGRLTGHCGICWRRLTDPHSKTLGIGPECIKKLNQNLRPRQISLSALDAEAEAGE